MDKPLDTSREQLSPSEQLEQIETGLLTLNNSLETFYGLVESGNLGPDSKLSSDYFTIHGWEDEGKVSSVELDNMHAKMPIPIKQKGAALIHLDESVSDVGHGSVSFEYKSGAGLRISHLLYARVRSITEKGVEISNPELVKYKGDQQLNALSINEAKEAQGEAIYRIINFVGNLLNDVYEMCPRPELIDLPAEIPPETVIMPIELEEVSRRVELANQIVQEAIGLMESV